MSKLLRYSLIGGVFVIVAWQFIGRGALEALERPAAVSRSQAESNADYSPAERQSHGAGWGASPFGDGNPVAPAMADPRRRSATLYGRNGRALDFGGKSAAQVIAEARTGGRMSAEAAYRAYQAESVCARLDEAVPELHSADDRAQAEEASAGIRKFCAGVTAAQVGERLQLLAQAARAGNAQAQIDFYFEGPYGRTVDLETVSNDPIVQQWKKDTVTNLQSAAMQGTPFALALLAQVYDHGEIAPRDPALALSYTIAAAEARHARIDETQLRKRFGDAMTAAQFQEAIQQGMLIARDCCGRK